MPTLGKSNGIGHECELGCTIPRDTTRFPAHVGTIIPGTGKGGAFSSGRSAYKAPGPYNKRLTCRRLPPRYTYLMGFCNGAAEAPDVMVTARRCQVDQFILTHHLIRRTPALHMSGCFRVFRGRRQA